MVYQETLAISLDHAEKCGSFRTTAEGAENTEEGGGRQSRSFGFSQAQTRRQRVPSCGAEGCGRPPQRLAGSGEPGGWAVGGDSIRRGHACGTSLLIGEPGGEVFGGAEVEQGLARRLELFERECAEGFFAG